MSAPKNYTVKQMENEPGFAEDVKELMAAHPLWKLRHAREIAAIRAMTRRIKNAGQPAPWVLALTKEDAQEVLHKMTVLAETEDLQESYGITQQQANELVASVPRSGGKWALTGWTVDVVRGELADHAVVLRHIALDAYNGGAVGQSLRIHKQAGKFERAVQGAPQPDNADRDIEIAEHNDNVPPGEEIK
jgi:hypothetical protein